MEAPFAAFLCDFDGVLRFHDLAAKARIENAYGLAAGTIGGLAAEPERWVPAMTGKITRDQWFASVIPALTGMLRSEERARALLAEWDGARTWLDHEALALLAQARTRVPVVLVSNATSELTEHLRALGIDGAFDSVVSSYDVGVAKPDPQIFEIAAARVSADLDRCLFVDDVAENVHAAAALGMTAVLYRELGDLRRALRPLLDEPPPGTQP
jgi:putative hydrolase of the HAD superfamily